MEFDKHDSHSPSKSRRCFCEKNSNARPYHSPIEYRLRVLLFFSAILAVLAQSTSEHDIKFESLSAETRKRKAAMARFAPLFCLSS
jgi:hypothetical protein